MQSLLRVPRIYRTSKFYETLQELTLTSTQQQRTTQSKCLLVYIQIQRNTSSLHSILHIAAGHEYYKQFKLKKHSCFGYSIYRERLVGYITLTQIKPRVTDIFFLFVRKTHLNSTWISPVIVVATEPEPFGAARMGALGSAGIASGVVVCAHYCTWWANSLK